MQPPKSKQPTMFQEEPVQIPGTVEETPVPIDLIDTIAARFDQNVLEQTKNKTIRVL